MWIVDIFKRNKKLIITIVVLAVVFSIVMLSFYIFNSRKSIDYYKNEVKNVLNALSLSGKNLVFYANEYVSKKNSLENSIITLLNNSNTILTSVTSYRDTCAKNISDMNDILTQSTTDANTSKDQLNLSNTSLTGIQNIVNEITPTPSVSPGIDFASSINSIENLKNKVMTNYTVVQGLLNNVSSHYLVVIQTQQTIANNLSSAYDAANNLLSYVNSLNNSLKNTDEYIQVVNSVSKAQRLLDQLSIVKTSVSNTSSFYNQINTLYNTLSNQINTVQPYLDNVLTVFSAATQNSNITLNSYINQLNTIFSSVASIIGIINATNTQTPTPFTTPYTISTLPPGQNSILYYYNNSNTIITNIMLQFNTIVDNYNKIVANLNTINSMTNSSTSDINTNINNLNHSLLSSQNILKNYFGGSTTPGVITATPAPQVTSMSTSSPFTFSTLPPISQFLSTNNVSYLNPGTYSYTIQKTGPHFIQLWGGGQSGQNSTTTSGGNGGNGGWYTSKYINLTQGTVLNISVGSGGSGNLVNGGTTTITGPSISISAAGGGISNGGDIQGTSGGQKGSYDSTTTLASSGLSFTTYPGRNTSGS